MLDEVLLQRGAVIVERTVFALPADLVEAVNAAVEIPLDGAAGKAGELGNPVVGESLGFQPDHFRLRLDPGVRVMVPLVTKDVENCGREGECTRDRLPPE